MTKHLWLNSKKLILLPSFIVITSMIYEIYFIFIVSFHLIYPITSSTLFTFIIWRQFLYSWNEKKRIPISRRHKKKIKFTIQKIRLPRSLHLSKQGTFSSNWIWNDMLNVTAANYPQTTATTTTKPSKCVWQSHLPGIFKPFNTKCVKKSEFRTMSIGGDEKYHHLTNLNICITPMYSLITKAAQI